MYVPTPLTEYVITPMPDGTYSVWNEPKDTRYAVWQGPNKKWHCNCFHCTCRKVVCKHIELVKTSKREETHVNNTRPAHFTH